MGEQARRLSQELAGAVAAHADAVVRVEGRRRGASSGVVHADGVVVTAHHGLEWDEDVTVGLADGTSVEAKVLGRDPGTDLAALEVPKTGRAALGWADLAGLAPGHLVLGLSRPGRALRASLGIVSAVGGSWRTSTGGRIDHELRTDLGLFPGFSGGLLVGADGAALGLNTAGFWRGQAAAVPGATIRRVVESLRAHGRVRRGYLGVGMQPVRLPAAIEAQTGQPAALLLTAVEPDTPAARAGLLLGDALLAAEGRALRHPADLLPSLEEERIGQPLALRILRAGALQDVTIVVGTREERPRG